MSKVLFCLPRFHTNAAPWVRLLQEAGHDVAVHVQRTGPSEDHRRVIPQIIPPAGWAVIAARILPRKADPDHRAAPPLRAYWRRMHADAPDVVVVRGLSRWFCVVAAVIALLQGRRVVVYDQDDPEPRQFSGTWARRVLSKALGMGCITARLAPDGVRSAAFAPSLPFGASDTGRYVGRKIGKFGRCRSAYSDGGQVSASQRPSRFAGSLRAAGPDA